MSHNNQKKIAAINDYSGFGRCSIAVELPIISALKVQFEDFTESMPAYIKEWEKLNLKFDGICTGFLGSHKQIEIVRYFFDIFKTPDNIVVVDPVMGDYGNLYATYTKETCEEMKKLVSYANILTPNLTEACILTGREYNAEYGNEELEIIAKQGPSKIVITGIVRGAYIANYCYEDGCGGYEIKTTKVGTQRSGTGDIFTAIIAADAVNKVNFHESVRKASQFIKKCIMKSIELEIPVTDGVCFEELLTTLR